jgi:hypothetical protein
MRIYDGSPRTDWEEVLRSIGAFADGERLKEILFLELEQGFILQGLGPPNTGTWSEGSGNLTKRTHELVEDEVGKLVDQSAAHRGEATADHATVGVNNYYEQAMRVIGKWIDTQHPRDVFLFEQEGGFVIRMLLGTASGVGHQLAEFTRDEIVAMIDAAPQERSDATDTPTAR